MPLPLLALLSALTTVPTVTTPFLAGSMVTSIVKTISSDDKSKNTSNGDEECTVAEAANLLGLSEYTVKKKIRDKKLIARIVGKKYMVSLASIQEYSRKTGKSGQILGESYLDIDGISEDIWNNSTLLQAFIESAKLQQNILSLECKKLELSKKMLTKTDDDKVNELSQQIMDKEILSLEVAKNIKLCEMRLLSLEENVNN
ncbi:helix-turn-helix domain-containing protein [Dialister invisus]